MRWPPVLLVWCLLFGTAVAQAHELLDKDEIWDDLLRRSLNLDFIQPTASEDAQTIYEVTSVLVDDQLKSEAIEQVGEQSLAALKRLVWPKLSGLDAGSFLDELWQAGPQANEVDLLGQFEHYMFCNKGMPPTVRVRTTSPYRSFGPEIQQGGASYPTCERTFAQSTALPMGWVSSLVLASRLALAAEALGGSDNAQIARLAAALIVGKAMQTADPGSTGLGGFVSTTIAGFANDPSAATARSRVWKWAGPGSLLRLAAVRFFMGQFSLSQQDYAAVEKLLGHQMIGVQVALGNVSLALNDGAAAKSYFANAAMLADPAVDYQLNYFLLRLSDVFGEDRILSGLSADFRQTLRAIDFSTVPERDRRGWDGDLSLILFTIGQAQLEAHELALHDLENTITRLAAAGKLETARPYLVVYGSHVAQVFKHLSWSFDFGQWTLRSDAAKSQFAPTTFTIDNEPAPSCGPEGQSWSYSACSTEEDLAETTSFFEKGAAGGKVNGTSLTEWVEADLAAHSPVAYLKAAWVSDLLEPMHSLGELTAPLSEWQYHPNSIAAQFEDRALQEAASPEQQRFVDILRSSRKFLEEAFQ